MAELYCPVAACWSSSQPPSFRRGIHGESVPRDLIDSQVAAGAEPCDPGAKHREVVEMQPGRSTLLPCGDEWFGFSVVSKIDRYPNFKSLGCKFGAHLHCLGYRKNAKRKTEWRKNAARRSEFCFELEYPIKRSAFARFTFTDAKAADESQRYTIPKVDISSDQVLLLQDLRTLKRGKLGPVLTIPCRRGTWWPTLPG